MVAPEKKGNMSVMTGREQVERDTVNVVSLFGSMNVAQAVELNDPLETLIQESMIEDTVLVAQDIKVRKVVNENQFPDQSMFILEEQLSSLKSSLNRIKFYLDDLDDLLPR